jgi:hypothetical protein
MTVTYYSSISWTDYKCHGAFSSASQLLTNNIIPLITIYHAINHFHSMWQTPKEDVVRKYAAPEYRGWCDTADTPGVVPHATHHSLIVCSYPSSVIIRSSSSRTSGPRSSAYSHQFPTLLANTVLQIFFSQLQRCQ